MWEKERDEIYENGKREGYSIGRADAELDSAARREALMNELDTFCINIDHYGTDKRANTRRRNCNKCWKELKANPTSEVEESGN